MYFSDYISSYCPYSWSGAVGHLLKALVTKGQASLGAFGVWPQQEQLRPPLQAAGLGHPLPLCRMGSAEKPV